MLASSAFVSPLRMTDWNHSSRKKKTQNPVLGECRQELAKFKERNLNNAEVMLAGEKDLSALLQNDWSHHWYWTEYCRKPRDELSP